jgi:hypothetical protein
MREFQRSDGEERFRFAIDVVVDGLLAGATPK